MDSRIEPLLTWSEGSTNPLCEQLFFEQSFDRVLETGGDPIHEVHEEVSEMHTAVRPARTAPATTTAAQRRRRHLAVYYRALRAAETPEQRSQVAQRYRKLFALSQPSAEVVDLNPIDLAQNSAPPTVRLAS